MAKLARGLVPLFEYLKTKRAGDLLTWSELCTATGWKESTLKTYVNKNKLAGLLGPTADSGRFRVLMDGAMLRAEDIAGALTQVTERPVAVFTGDRLVGQAGEYVLGRKRGEGAVGQVFEARSIHTGEDVAIKVCSPRPDLLEPSVLGNVRDRFRREYKLGPKITHDFLVRYRDWGEHRGTPFLVMELAEETLRDVLNARTRLSLEESLAVVGRVVDALGWLHAQNCIHRDVKPANILRTARGFVLGDFGIVQWGDLSRSYTGAGTITKASIQLGSWFYMSPEQLDTPHESTAASDVYALAVTWIELLTGEAPAPHKVAARRVPSPSGVEEIDLLIERMTEYTPVLRPPLSQIAEIVAEHAARAAPSRAINSSSRRS